MNEVTEVQGDALQADLIARAEGLERRAAIDRETGNSIEETIDAGEGYTPDDAVDVAFGLLHGADSAEETASLLRKAAAALAARQPVGQEPVAFAVESAAFEAHAKGAGLNMEQHPLHYLFLDETTHAARQAWKAALQFQPPAQCIDLGQPNEPGRTLYVDLDGVMADFDGAFPAVFGLDHRSLADDEMWGHINGHPSFFRDLPPMAGAVEFFRSVEHLSPVILTACPKSNYAHVAAQKRAWVRAHLSRTCLVLPVMGGRHKPLFMHQPGDVLIDDFGKNCAAWTEAGGIAIKHEGDWTATREALARADTQPTLANAAPPQDLRTQLGEVR